MKRVGIFICLGPFFGFIVVCIIGGEGAIQYSAAMLPIVYMVLVLPLALCALVDLFFEESANWERLVVAAITGFMATWIVLLLLAIDFVKQSWEALLFCFAGAIPALICSWIVNRNPEGRKELSD